MKYTIASVLTDEYKYMISVRSHSVKNKDKVVDFTTVRLEVDGYLCVDPMGSLIYMPRSEMGLYGLLPIERRHLGVIRQQQNKIRKLTEQLKGKSNDDPEN